MKETLLTILLLIEIPLLPGLLIRVYLQHIRKRISRISVKYAIDRLPMGLACYQEDGMVLLRNPSLTALSEQLSAGPLMNCVRFHEKLLHTATEHGTVCDNPDAFTLALSDRWYDINREHILVEGVPYIQLSATDTTELHREEERLRKQMTALDSAHEKLRDYEKNIATLAQTEAFYATKTRIHDMFGQTLLSTRYYLTEADARVDIRQLITQWNNVMEDLQSAGTGQGLTQLHSDTSGADTALKALSAAAGALGMTLQIKGSFPEEGMRLTRLIISCTRICMTNASRHGGATTMTIDFEETGPADAYRTIRFYNNGTLPVKEIKKGGGLQQLETLMKEHNGTVSYETQGTFGVIVKLPVV